MMTKFFPSCAMLAVTGFLAGAEPLGDERNVADRRGAPADELLPARIRKRRGLDAEYTLGMGVCALHFLLHHGQRVVFQRMIARPQEVSSAGVGTGVIADLVSLRGGLLPAIEPLLQASGVYVEGDFDAEGVE